MRVISLKNMSIPKVAVLATGAAAALLVATINPAPVAQAFPSRNANCANCHTASTSVATTAAPSTTTPVGGASYTVAITLAANPTGGNSGYAILPVTAGTGTTNGGDVGPDLSFTATMAAPAAAGTYTYNVYTNQGSQDTGQTGSATYTITVGSVVTTPPVTTTTPPVSGASIGSLSPTHGVVGSTVTIDGVGFGTSANVQFGTADAVELAGTVSTDGKMVVSVPANMNSNFLPATSVVTQKVWNRHARVVQVTVTPEGGSASIGVSFTVDKARGHHKGDTNGDHEGDHEGDHKGDDGKRSRH